MSSLGSTSAISKVLPSSTATLLIAVLTNSINFISFLVNIYSLVSGSIISNTLLLPLTTLFTSVRAGAT